MKKSLSQTLTDLDIQALVDSQLDWEEEKSVWSGISKDRSLYARYQELLAQKKLLLAWWKGEKAQNAETDADTKESEPVAGKLP